MTTANDAFLVGGATPSEHLKRLAAKVVELNRQIAEAEAYASLKKKELNHITQKEMVDAMIECGFSDLKLPDNTKFKLSTFVTGSLPKDEEAKQKAIDWLAENGADGIIKSEVSCQFARNQYQLAEKLAEELQQQGYPVSLNTSVHSATLQAWAREALENGHQDIPFETLGLGTGQYVKVTYPKDRL